jgi:hypothetical protein
MAASSGPAGRACLIHHRTDELLLKPHTACGGQATSPIKEGARHVQSFCCLSSRLVELCGPGQLCIMCHPLDSVLFRPAVLAVEKLDWPGISDEFRSLKNPPVP